MGQLTRACREGTLLRVCVLAMTLAVGVLTAAAPAAAQAPPAPEEESVRLPAGYSDDAAARFWKRAEAILGSRLGYTAETDQSSASVTFEVGAVRMTGRDKKRLRHAAPSWAEIETFRTRYSIGDLREFGSRAEAALRAEGLHRLWGGFGYLGKPDLVTITLVRDDDRARDVLRRELPDGAFTVEIGRFHLALGQPGSKDAQREASWGWVESLAVAAGAIGAAGLVLSMRRRRPSRKAVPAQNL